MEQIKYPKYNLHDLVYVYDENELKQVKIISVEFTRFKDNNKIYNKIIYGIKFFENSTLCKYYIDDIVYFFRNNKIYQAIVYSVKIVNYYDKYSKQNEYSIKYQVYYDNNDWTELKEKEIFSNINDLYASFEIIK